MKTRSIVNALWATGAVCGWLLVAQRAAHANSDAPGVDFKDYASTGGNYVQEPTATCVTGAPDYDDDCTDGDYVTFMVMYDTTTYNDFGQPYLDMEVHDAHLSPGDHFYCYERLICSDKSEVEIHVTDAGCHEITCPAGTYVESGLFNYGVNSTVSP